MAYDMFGTREMTEAINQLKPVSTFFLDTFFKRTETHDTEAIDIDIYKGKRKVAPYTRSASKSKPISRTGFQTGSFKIPYIKISRGLDPAMAIAQRGIGENIYSAKSPKERAAEQLARDLAELEEYILRAEEIQAAQALINGLIIIKGEEVDAEIDLSRDPLLEFDAAASWDDPATDIHAQMRDWGLTMFRISGYTPDIIVAAHDALTAFFGNAVVQSMLDNRRLNIGTVGQTTVQKKFPGATYYGEFGNFSVWEYNEYYLDDADNTEKQLMPDGHILLASTGMRCVRHYGPIADMAVLQPLKRFVKKVVTEDPSTITAIAQTSPAMINHNPDATALIKVILP